MKGKLIVTFILASIAVNSFAQNVLDGVYEKGHTVTKKIIAFPHLREADVMWSKRIWRVIDLNEKINLPLKYPINPIKDRKSLINVIMDAVNEGSLTAYKKGDDEFTFQMTKQEVETIGGAGLDSSYVANTEPPYEMVKKVFKKEFGREKIVGYRVKEDYFFDKQRSVLESRIVGIAPMVYEEDDQGNKRDGAKKVPIFWIYYPEARKLLTNSEVFNRFNDAERRSFDDIFVKKMYGSYIVKESNVYDRRVEDYRTGLDALLEAQKIKDDIFNFEHDLWEY